MECVQTQILISVSESLEKVTMFSVNGTFTDDHIFTICF